MLKAFSVSQAQQLDRLAIQAFGLSPLVLMENAGHLTAQEILRSCQRKKRRRVCLFCGQGSNGGDGLVIARHLLNAGMSVHVFIIGKPQGLKEEAMLQHRILKKMKCPIRFIQGVSLLVLAQIGRADVLVDALFGIGLSRPIEEPFRSVIEAINRSKKYIVAVDVPSGLDATTGKILNTCVKASCTVTFAVMKKGFLRNEGPFHVGKVKVVDIGIPQLLIKKMARKG